MDKKQIIADLIKNGAVLVKDIVVKNVTITPMEEYVRLGLTLDQEVDGFVAKDDGTYEKIYIDKIPDNILDKILKGEE